MKKISSSFDYRLRDTGTTRERAKRTMIPRFIPRARINITTYSVATTASDSQDANDAGTESTIRHEGLHVRFEARHIFRVAETKERAASVG